MPVSVRHLSEQWLESITICGKLPEKPSRALASTLKAIGRKTAAIKGQHGREYVFLNVSQGGDGFKKSNWHVHVDIESLRIYGQARPLTGSKKRDVEGALSSIEGINLLAFVTAGFLIRLNEIPETSIVRAMLATVNLGTISLSTAGGKVRVGGGPVHELRWTISPDGSEAMIWLEAWKEVVINDGFIEREMHAMGDAFRLLVIRDKDHGNG